MKKKSFLLVLISALMVVLAACGFGGKDKEEDKGGEKGKDSKQDLNLVIPSEPPSLNPQKATDSTSGAILRSAFEGLTRIDKDGKVQPAVAEKIDVSEDQKTYTFKLRDSKWSNGDAVTAEDFKYAWTYALDPKNASEYASILYPIKNAQAFNEGKVKVDEVGIEVKDDKTLVVNLENPTPYFTEITAFYTSMPVNAKVAKENKKWSAEGGEGYVSNGPFTLSEWKHSASLTLKKNDQYWDKDNVSLNTVKIQMVESEATANRMFKNGDIDFLGSPFQTVPLDAIDGYKKDKSLNIQDYAAIYEYKFNTTGKFTKNANIRKALALSINRQGLIDNVTKGQQTPAVGMVPKAIAGFEDDRGYMKDNDIDEAKKALEAGMKELGIKDAKDISVGISINTSEAHAAIAQYIQEGWSKNLGINVKIDNSEWQVFLDKMTSLDYDIGRMGWIADYNDAYTFLERYDTAKNGNNDTGWESKEYKALMEKVVKETDAAKREQHLKDAEKILMTEFPVAPVYYYTNLWVEKDYVKNMAPSRLGEISLKDVKLEK
ncbi:oligopeptide-binding protein OppA [Kurthia zopfii]|uniref:Oligopeptide transport system substrate-binding protein n=1 Tax=Kurthia zopfii TaxID=1650 RepID=A0A8B4QD98_9BACL|nr:peptide ABC transporter substrate-binding protein [Kurthia zopfii]PWI23826.1 ABC transporter substrate-binding protein [Kurthia zopfii]TDR43402.1 oligopeptide transport system substrate-binding protein [Kurthia zopfii]GEK32384.1 oligopeptide-binding protein OppA [Kurthia zopfii]STX10655.1 Stage 0 sporulation protein KA [Kurthia zopfii]